MIVEALTQWQWMQAEQGEAAKSEEVAGLDAAGLSALLDAELGSE